MPYQSLLNDSPGRFSGRTEVYQKYRPSYPKEILGALSAGTGFSSDWVVADIGAGTGKLSELFLNNGNHVIGVEPDACMREASIAAFSQGFPFAAVHGYAENTGLPDECCDIVVVGQAFHWFDPAHTRAEFSRILGRPRWVALIWNRRLIDSSPFQSEYESILRSHALDYSDKNHRHLSDRDIASFFSPSNFQHIRLPNHQTLDLEGLKGRVLSASYTPVAGRPGHTALMREIEMLFEVHQVNGRVTFEYETGLYWGNLDINGSSGTSGALTSSLLKTQPHHHSSA